MNGCSEIQVSPLQFMILEISSEDHTQKHLPLKTLLRLWGNEHLSLFFTYISRIRIFSAYVTDRPAPNSSDHNETHDSFPIQVCNSWLRLRTIWMAHLFVRLKLFGHFQKLKQEKRKYLRGRAKGKTRILTDTPEKLEISAGWKILIPSKKKPTTVGKVKKVIDINKKIDLTTESYTNQRNGAERRMQLYIMLNLL